MLIRRLVLIIVFILCPFSAGLFCQSSKVYQIVGIYTNADLNYVKLKALNKMIAETREPLFLFDAVPGTFTVYKFISSYWSPGAGSTENQLHQDILVVKVDRKNMIHDAYQYTLDNQVLPLSNDLYGSPRKGIILRKLLNIKELELKNKTGLLKDDALIYNFYLGQERF